MPEWKTVKNMTMFADEVMPKLRAAALPRVTGDGALPPRRGCAEMAEYREEHIDVNGIDTAVLTAGEGDPLVYFHGAGTMTGFDALLPLAERVRLIVPIHPGFGAAPTIRASTASRTTPALPRPVRRARAGRGLARRALGRRLHGRMVRDHEPQRVRRLVLGRAAGACVSPSTRRVDMFSMPDEEVLSYLVADMSLFEGKVPMPPPPEFLAERYRESTSWARMAWKRPYDIKLPKWLHRIAAPTLILWGDADRLHPGRAGGHLGRADPERGGARPSRASGTCSLDEASEAVDVVAEFVGAGVPAS